MNDTGTEKNQSLHIVDCHHIHTEGVHDERPRLLLSSILKLQDSIKIKLKHATKIAHCSEKCKTAEITKMFTRMQMLMGNAQADLSHYQTSFIVQCKEAKKKITDDAIQTKKKDSNITSDVMKTMNESLKKLELAQKTAAREMAEAVGRLSVIVEEVSKKFENVVIQQCAERGGWQTVWGGVRAAGKFLVRTLGKLWDLFVSVGEKMYEHRKIIAIASIAIAVSVAIAPYIAAGAASMSSIAAGGIGAQTCTGQILGIISNLSNTLCHWTMANPFSGYIVASIAGIAGLLYFLAAPAATAATAATAGAAGGSAASAPAVNALKDMLFRGKGGANKVSQNSKDALFRRAYELGIERQIVPSGADYDAYYEQSTEDWAEFEKNPQGLFATVIGTTGTIVKMGFLTLFVALIAGIGAAFSCIFSYIGAVLCAATTGMASFFVDTTDMILGGTWNWTMGSLDPRLNLKPDDTAPRAVKAAFDNITENAQNYGPVISNVAGTVFNALSNSWVLAGMVGTLSMYAVSAVKMEDYNNSINLSHYQNELVTYSEALEDSEKRNKLAEEGQEAANGISTKVLNTAYVEKLTREFKLVADQAFNSLIQCNPQGGNLKTPKRKVSKTDASLNEGHYKAHTRHHNSQKKQQKKATERGTPFLHQIIPPKISEQNEIE